MTGRGAIRAGKREIGQSPFEVQAAGAGPANVAKPEKVGPPPAWHARRQSPMIPPEGRGSVFGGGVNSFS